jgi:diacylglycerol kinase (CTP)
VTTIEAAPAPADRAPTATRHDLQLGRRLFHLGTGVATATAYALFFSHQQVVQIFGAIACLVYIVDRIRIAYPETVARRAPWVNRSFVRAEEQVREAAMTPFAIAVLLTILAVPKLAALVAIYTLAIADPLAAVERRDRDTRPAVLRWGTDSAGLTIAGASTVIGIAAAGCELLPLRIDDNLTIPIFVGFATWVVAILFGVQLT